MIILGLTGSIGMGKSTTAKMFMAEGVPVNDADQVVHDLYIGEAVAPIEAAFPGTSRDGHVDRTKLGAWLMAHPEDFKKVEAIVHPLVRRKEQEFLTSHRAQDTPAVLLDIPLLFETGGQSRVDHVIVVSCSAETQAARVMARPDMTEEKFRSILAKQVPDAEKRQKADFIINTEGGIDAARDQVSGILKQLGLKQGSTGNA